MDLIEIILKWKKELNIEEITDKPGLYQIYGIHIAYGPDKLLYLGKADNINKRLREHDHWICKEQDIIYRYAEIKESEKDYLADLESLLIFTHSPFYNTSSMSDFHKAHEEDIIIYNIGERGTLVPEISSKYWEIFRNPDKFNI